MSSLFEIITVLALAALFVQLLGKARRSLKKSANRIDHKSCG